MNYSVWNAWESIYSKSFQITVSKWKAKSSWIRNQKWRERDEIINHLREISFIYQIDISIILHICKDINCGMSYGLKYIHWNASFSYSLQFNLFLCKEIIFSLKKRICQWFYFCETTFITKIHRKIEGSGRIWKRNLNFLGKFRYLFEMIYYKQKWKFKIFENFFHIV